MVPAFFAFTLFVGLIAVPSYGISWDEKAMFVLGLRVYNYVFEGATYPVNAGIRFHGSLVELFLYGIPKVLEINYARHIFILRHFLNYLTFFGGIVAFYFLGKRHFKSVAWGLVLAVMLFLSPRQFGHAFYNARDIPTMSLWILAMLTMSRLLEKPSFRRAAEHGAACGLAMSMRMPSVFLPVLTIGFLVLMWWKKTLDHDRRAGKIFLVTTLTVLVTSAMAVVVFWPLLWESPLKNFSEALANMSTVQNQPGGFYFGHRIFITPWHWIPVWMFITIPLLYTALFVVGLGVMIRDLLRDKLLMVQSPHLPFLAWFFVPPIAIFVLQSPIFDEWRHVYFIYPAFLIIACTGIKYAYESFANIRPAYALHVFLSLGLLHVLCIGFWMMRNHPFQYVYFSVPSRFIEGNFELDYWGISFKQGLEKVLEIDPAERIPVVVYASSGTDNTNSLTREQRGRLLVHARGDAHGKYLLDNFRGREYKRQFDEKDKVASVRVSGMEILAIYKNPNWNRDTFDPRMRMDDTSLMLGIDAKLMD